jgi:ribonuclease-3
MPQLNSLLHRLGYGFKNLALLEQALTHCSASAENNERLEFLGDSLINFVITEELYRNFPQASEGQLTRFRASLVKQETLAELAEEFNLSQHVRLGPGELRSGAANRPSILADALEAIVAAMLLDSDFQTVRYSIANWFASRLDQLHLDDNHKDPKTTLQELLQARKMPLPHYHILSIEGETHAQQFCVECEIEGIEGRPQGVGSTRRRAEQEAAAQMIEIVKQW